MFNLFPSKSKFRDQYAATWPGILEQAKRSLPPEIPPLPRQMAKWFIQDWNTLYEKATENEKVGLAVLAYRVDIHRYAAGMLIEGRKETRLSGVRILGYMREESVWPILKDRLLRHSDSDLSLAALQALFQINERRAKEELKGFIEDRSDWPSDVVTGILSPFYPNGKLTP